MIPSLQGWSAHFRKAGQVVLSARQESDTLAMDRTIMGEEIGEVIPSLNS
jgi:hypothetical protein